jgi:hypothetical protein
MSAVGVRPSAPDLVRFVNQRLPDTGIEQNQP